MTTATIDSAEPVPILVVDDNFAKRLALKAVLAPLGYRIVEADSGVAALRCVLAEDFAVILLDVLMPVMDGFETAALIRQRAESEMTPIIFITAYKSDEIVKADLYAEGAVDFIFAPVPPAELRAKVSVFANLFTRASSLARQARELQASTDQLRLLTDAAPIGIFQTDAQHRYVYTNQRWSEITGLSAEVALGRRWDSIVAAELRSDLVAELGTGAADRGELSHRFAMSNPVSGPRIVLVTSKSIADRNGAVTGWVGTLADVTVEVGVEAALSGARDAATQASQMKSDFLANMSHEIRTPMNGVIGMTDLLLETDLDPRQRDYAQTVRNSGEALLAIINDILDFSKVEAGKVEVDDVQFDLRSMVDDLVDLLAGPAQAKGLELVAIIERAVPAVVCGDPGRVRQVLTNMVANAIKFTQIGEVVVRVAVERALDDHGLIRVEVSDTGVGIAPDDVASVFEPFVQGSTSRGYGGTGLGLSISARLVKLMAGESGVTSSLGVGSTFWFTVPIGVAKGLESAGRHTPDAELAGVRILIVDDSGAQRRVLSEKARDWNMFVETADSGLAALTTLRAAAALLEPFAVVLLDRDMPGMDGLELKEAIIADPELDPRLVLMTGLSQQGSLGEGATGICATVTKPVHRQDLHAGLLCALGLVPEASAAAAHSRRRSQSRGEAGRVLVAEDNLINQKVAVAILTNAGYLVDTVLNGVAAVEAVATDGYDVILMDCNMPKMNGYEATAAIRGGNRPGRRTPIIAMTAAGSWEDRTRCLAAGMNSYLAKPFSRDALLALVARFVETAKAPPERVGHLLLVEDNPVNQQVGLAMLEILGYHVDVVADGAAAVAAAIQTRYDAILMDCHIPILDGFEATREIRRLQVASTPTPIIAVTASAMASDLALCLDAGMDDYLTKPLTLKTLAEILTRWAPGGSIPAALADIDEADDAGPPPALDPQIVDRLTQLGTVAGEDLIEKLTALFVTEACSRVAEFRVGLAARDAGALRRAAHALSGSSATLGATGLAGLCSRLASDSAADNLAGAQGQLDAIDAELARVLAALGSNGAS